MSDLPLHEQAQVNFDAKMERLGPIWELANEHFAKVIPVEQLLKNGTTPENDPTLASVRDVLCLAMLQEFDEAKKSGTRSNKWISNDPLEHFSSLLNHLLYADKISGDNYAVYHKKDGPDGKKLDPAELVESKQRYEMIKSRLRDGSLSAVTYARDVISPKLSDEIYNAGITQMMEAVVDFLGAKQQLEVAGGGVPDGCWPEDYSDKVKEAEAATLDKVKSGQLSFFDVGTILRGQALLAVDRIFTTSQRFDLLYPHNKDRQL